jgi:serine/threonine-protein kinase
VVPAFQPQRFGNYVLTAHLGRGGMADVFRAQHVGAAGFERTCVVKRILRPYNDDRDFVEMFINEAKIAAQLSHPNIAQVYELGEVDGEYFMAMEYVKGMDLLHLLRYFAKERPDERWLPPDVAAYITRELCRALAHAHDRTDEREQPQPIVHRDVSPQNVMLSFDGQVKVIDFGIAKAMAVREETRSGTLKGKIAYMSPEQVRGDNPSAQSDIFAAGVVLYEMLIGRRLFKGENDFDTLQRVQNLVVPPPSRSASWIPPELDAVVMRALERDRQQRYPRAALMARDLDEWLQARFSIEHMAEYMNATIPPEARAKMVESQGARTPSRASRSASEEPDTSKSLEPPTHEPGNSTRPGTLRAGFLSAAQSGTPRLVLLAVVAAALIAAAGIGGYVAMRSRTNALRASSESAPAPDLGNGAHAETRTPAAPKPTEITPPPSPGVVTVRPAAEPKRDRAPHPTARATAKPTKKPKIDAFDESEGTSAKPKIEAFDD